MSKEKYHSLLFWIVCSAIFLIVGWIVIFAGLNPDDMRAMSQDMVYPMYNYGRWTSHIVHNYFGPFLIKYTILQLFLSFLLCSWTSLMLAKYSSEKGDYFAAFVIFVFGATHPYFVDVLNFNELILAYSFCIAGSVWAFSNIVLSRPRVFSWVASTQIMALVFSTYPPFIMIGAFVPLMILFRADKYTLRESIRALIAGMILCIIAIVVYGLEYWLVGKLIVVEPTIGQSFISDLPTLWEKLKSVPRMTQSVHSTALSDVGSRSIRLLFLAISFIVAVLALCAIYLVARYKNGPERTVVILRGIAALFGAFVILPLSVWLLYRMNFLVGRSLGYYGFIIGAMLVATLSLSGKRIDLVRPMVIALCGSFFLISSFVGWKMANVLNIAATRDWELASQISDEIVDLPDFDGEYVNIVGGLKYDDLHWGLFRPTTNFSIENTFNAALAPFIKLKRWPIHIPVGPRPCPAFPAPGSTYTHNGVAYVCLEQRDVGWLTGRCSPLQNLGGLVCVDDAYVAFLKQKCMRSDDDTGMVRVAEREDPSDEPVQVAVADADYIATTNTGDGCAFFSRTGISGLYDLNITGFSMDRVETWTEIVPTDVLKTGFPDG